MKNNLDRARESFQKGESDVRTVRLLVNAGGPFDTAFFHAQEAVRMFFVGILALSDGTLPISDHSSPLQTLGCSRIQDWPFADLDLSLFPRGSAELPYDLDFWPNGQQTNSPLKVAEEVRSRTMAYVSKNSRPEQD